MAFDSFRDFVNALDKAGELKRISQPVATELEITEIADREMKLPGGGKALLFEKPTINGVVSPFPVAINTLGSHKRMAMSMGAESVDEVANELGALMKAKPPTSFKEAIKLLSLALDLRHAKPKTVKSGSCKDVIHKYDAPPSRKEPWPAAPSVELLNSYMVKSEKADALSAVDDSTIQRFNHLTPPSLLNLPILKCWPLDGGRFITLPCVVTRDPDTGERNVGMYRIQIYDDKTTGMHWQLQKVAARHGRRYYERGERMPVAIFIGGDPMFPFAATAPMPDGLDEFLLAGYLRKKSVEMIKCETNDLEVPANADFVIEGYIDPTEPLRDEGPVRRSHRLLHLARAVSGVSHHRHHAPQRRRLSRHHRRHPADGRLLHRRRVRETLPAHLQDEFPRDRGHRAAAEGVFHNLVFVSIKKTYPMQAYKIMHGLWGMGQMMFTKYIVVVDAGVNVHNTSEVLFHLTANTDPQRDSIFTKGPSDVLDHATSEIAIGSKLGIDATKKIPGEGFKRPWPPLIKMNDAVKAKVEKLFGSR